MNPCLAKTWSDYIAKVLSRKAGFPDHPAETHSIMSTIYIIFINEYLCIYPPHVTTAHDAGDAVGVPSARVDRQSRAHASIRK